MSEEGFSEVTQTSWGERIKTSLTGIVLGLVLFIGAFPLLFWNEGRAVKRYRALKEGQGQVVSVAIDRVDPANQGRLIHVSGPADTRETLVDSTFDVARRAIHLQRTVEMYQWRENKETRTEKQAGGKERKVTTYFYSKVWSARPISSSSFKRRGGHENPGRMPYEGKTFTAGRVNLGAFQLPGFLVREIDNWQPLPVDAAADLPAALGGRGQHFDDGYYLGDTPTDPAIGDVRVFFKIVEPGPVSIVAAQSGSTLAAYATHAGGTISLLQPGTVSAAEMFKTAHFHNRLLTWGIRAGGLILMFIGLSLLFKPLSVFADVIPLFGNIVQIGTGLIAFVLALCFALTVIGVAWIVHRPLLGIVLLGTALALVAVLILKRRASAKPAPVAAARPSAPPPPVPPSTRPVPPPPSPTPSPPAPPSPPTPPAVDATTTSGDEWIRVGKQAYTENRLAAAIDAFEKALAVNPANASVLFNLGVVRNKAGDVDGAREALEQAADMGHERARALLAAGKLDP